MRVPFWITTGLPLSLIQCYVLASLAMGDTPESGLLALPLEELAQVQVITASKSKEDVQDSPGITAVITQDDIQRLGANSLAEVLDHATSVFSLGTGPEPMGLVSMRGDIAESAFMPRVLMLLDGRPFRDSLNGGTDSVLLFAMPLSRIDRIEIVRGPGSVLYGTNAYIGVINVITQGSDAQKTIAHADYGSFDTRSGRVAYGQNFGQLKLAAGGTVTATQGWNFNVVDGNGVQNQIPLAALDGGGDLNLQYHGLTLHNYIGFINQDVMGNIADWIAPNPQSNTTRWISDLGYSTDFTKSWKASFNLTYNLLRVTQFYPVNSAKQDIFDNRSDDFLIETTHFFNLTDAIDLTAGGTINVQTGREVTNIFTGQGQPFNVLSGVNTDPLINVPFYRRALYELYAQSELRLNDDLKFIVGGQLNKTPYLNVDYVPRLGAVLSLENGFGSKVLYGQGYRTATAVENYFSVPGILSGNNALQPETITTYDVQVSYFQKTYNVALTYFNSHQDDVMTRTFPSGPGIAQTTINNGTISSQGLELEGSGSPIRILKLTGGVTYEWLHSTQLTAAGTNTTTDNSTGMPLTQIKLGATVTPIDALRFSLFDVYYGDFGNINAAHPTADPQVRNFHDVSLNLEYQATKRLKFNLAGKNMFSAPIEYPEILSHVINSIPGRPGISFYGGVTATL